MMGNERVLVGEFRILRRCVMQRNASEAFAFKQKQCTERRFAKLCRFLQHRMENWLQLAGRRADDTQHFRCRSLLLQRLSEIGRALAQFVEQPRVLDSDDRLCSEVLHQRDLLVAKSLRLLTVNVDSTGNLAFNEHWYGKVGPRAA
jgi:hypothetical protein